MTRDEFKQLEAGDVLRRCCGAVMMVTKGDEECSDIRMTIIMPSAQTAGNTKWTSSVGFCQQYEKVGSNNPTQQ